MFNCFKGLGLGVSMERLSTVVWWNWKKENLR